MQQSGSPRALPLARHTLWSRARLPRTCWSFALGLTLASGAAGCAESPIGDDYDAEVDPAWTARPVEPGLDALVPSDPLDGSPEQPRERGPDAARDAGSDAELTAIPEDAALPGLDAATGSDARVRDASPPVMEAATPPSCPAPQSLCGNACLDLGSNNDHCGECGRRCSSGQGCILGRCWNAPPSNCERKTNEKHVYLFCTPRVNWSAARARCIDAAMDLVVVDNANENSFVRSFDRETWLGASDLQTEGNWTVVPPGNRGATNGAALPYTNWESGEPNNDRTCTGLGGVDNCRFGEVVDEDCLLLRTTGRWNDAECTQERSYVCEMY